MFTALSEHLTAVLKRLTKALKDVPTDDKRLKHVEAIVLSMTPKLLQKV